MNSNLCQYSLTLFSQAISTKSGYDSEFSKELVLTCPGANSPEIYRVKTAVANCIKICWKKPVLKGNAKVKNYWVSFITFQVPIPVEQNLKIGLLRVFFRWPKLTHKICLKLTIMKPERHHWHSSNIVLVNFRHIIKF